MQVGNLAYSVVLTVYNKEQFISDTLKSVINQTYKNFELIIIDDGSTDASSNIIKSINDDRIKYFYQQNAGVSAARNLGIKKAQNEYVALLDGDDIWLPDYLDCLNKAINSYSDQFIFATAIAHKYGDKTIPATYSFDLNGKTTVLDFFKNSLKQPILSGSSIVFSKSILDKTGYFKTNLKSSEDTDMWINIGLNSSIVFIKSVKVLYRYDDNSLSNSDFSLTQKPKYDEYDHAEQTSKAVKKFIDQNRYSLALIAKIYGDEQSFKYYKNNLDMANLSIRRKILINSPRWLINFLLRIKALRGRKLYYRPLSLKKSS